MAPKRKRETELSQAEVWDDSALIRSWDEALEEYKMYHSIHARGEDVGQILEGLKKQKLLESSMGATGPEEATKEDASLEEAEEGEIDNQPEEIDTSKARDIPMETTTVEAEASNGQDTTPDINGIDLPRDQTAPQIGPKDESLKNLMMSWYYAGYYTGFHEGQQQIKGNANTS